MFSSFALVLETVILLPPVIVMSSLPEPSDGSNQLAVGPDGLLYASDAADEG
mgnify:CR=1 FL=1